MVITRVLIGSEITPQYLKVIWSFI